MKKLLANNSGSTLIELIIYISISSFILIDISAILSQVVYSQTRIEAISREDETARNIMRLTSESVEEAATVNSPSSVNAISSSLNITDTTGNTIIYSISSGIVYKQVNNNTAVAISSSDVYVTLLQFQVESEGGVSPSINIQINIQQNSTNASNLTHYETTAAQRKM